MEGETSPKVCGIGVSIDTRPGSKIYKTRVHYKGRVLNLGR